MISLTLNHIALRAVISEMGITYLCATAAEGGRVIHPAADTELALTPCDTIISDV